MTLLITSVFNQLVYPGRAPGRSFDCWVVSCIQCRSTVAPGKPLPTITEFRANAGDPVDGDHDAGSLTDIITGITKTWPEQRIKTYRAAPWAQFSADLKAQRLPASISVNSADLPLIHRYAYFGLHQITVFWQDGTWYVANPLAPKGSLPKAIGESQLRRAIDGYSNVGVYGVLFYEETDVPGVNYNPDPVMGSVKVAITGRSFFNPATKAWFAVDQVPREFLVAGSGTVPDKPDIPPSLRTKPIWVIDVGGTDCWIRQEDTGPLIKPPVVIPNCTPAVVKATNALIDEVLAVDVGAFKAAVAARKIA